MRRKPNQLWRLALGIFVALAPLIGLAAAPIEQFAREFCAECHDADTRKADLDLQAISAESITKRPEAWEKVILRLQTRQMPPAGKKRPTEAGYNAAVGEIAQALDDESARNPNPGRPDTIRRLTRAEYQNAIRDLLSVEIDASTLLPKDDPGHGFDNVTVGNLSPTLLARYIAAAEKISRLAIGAAERVGGETIRLRPDLTQEEHVEGLPLGTRGGALIAHTFPQDAEYEIQVRLARDRNEEIEGLREAHQMELLLDRERIGAFTVAPPKGHKNFELVDQKLKLRARIPAGRHEIGVAFLKNPSSLLETKRQPYQAHFNMHRHPRLSPAVYQISINGPYDPKGPGSTASRRKIFGTVEPRAADEDARAQEILSRIARSAYRRPATEADLRKPMELFMAAKDRGFDSGIEAALGAILVSPNFLFRIERDPTDAKAGSAYAISDLELASRLSFFIWSSIPDDELLALAESGRLSAPEMIGQQVKRMLADSRSKALVSNFAGQWLHLRNLEAFTPELRLFPDFDDNLRQALRTETEMLFENILREDRSVMDLLKADYTFLNERLAKHYGIPHVYGDRFRRVSTREAEGRGGLLRQGSILTVTSYPNRTSPVIRGNWILANLIGTPAPPPPANVPALKDNTVAGNLAIRERLAEHRANAACAGCHNMMDPVGFALENFDAVGHWRTSEDGEPIDASGGLPDGSKFKGVDGLQASLSERPEVFVTTLTGKLLTYALGRGLDYYDAPAVRKIAREAAATDYRFSSIIAGVARSAPFTMRKAQ